MLLPVFLRIHGPTSKICKNVTTEPPTAKYLPSGLSAAPVGERRAMCDHIQDQVILFSIFVKSCRV